MYERLLSILLPEDVLLGTDASLVEHILHSLTADELQHARGVLDSLEPKALTVTTRSQARSSAANALDPKLGKEQAPQLPTGTAPPDGDPGAIPETAPPDGARTSERFWRLMPMLWTQNWERSSHHSSPLRQHHQMETPERFRKPIPVLWTQNWEKSRRHSSPLGQHHQAEIPVQL